MARHRGALDQRMAAPDTNADAERLLIAQAAEWH